MAKKRKADSLYMQIQSYLLDGIQAGRWKANEALPSENELSSQFGVSRITIKKAMDLLVEEGIVYRIQGKGSFVSADGKPVLYEQQNRTNAAKPIIALVMPRVNNQYTGNLLMGIEAAVQAAGAKLLFGTANDDPEKESQLISEALEWGASGIIIYPSNCENYNEEILRLTLSGFPIVVIDRYIRGVETNCVLSDHEGGAYEAVSYLLDSGHRNIAYASAVIPGTTSLEDRKNGYLRAMGGTPSARIYELTTTDTEEAEETIRSFLADRPDITAFFASHYSIGTRILRAFEGTGVQVPEDLSVVFFDDFENSELSRVPPTCVIQQEEEIGKKAAELVISMCRGKGSSRTRIVLPTKLVVRASTGPVPHRSRMHNERLLGIPRQ
ncbi:GntR family transcriptional regulator [Cohnella sp. GCM10020058]|uniref:GntR family transcriptional regulator n=1 Tax=Cohnella sp. GCM10020058 TaxID=3317330 RepID=UPI0036384CE7